MTDDQAPKQQPNDEPDENTPDQPSSSGANEPWTGDELTMADIPDEPAPAGPWTGDEQTLAETPLPVPFDGPWKGQERTLSETPVPPADGADAGTWTGDEQTLAETPLPVPFDGPWKGEERTLADTPVPPMQPDTWTGDEKTLADTPVPRDDAPWAGDERTLADTPVPPGQAGGATVGTWVGDERTMETPVTMPSNGPWTGDEGTLIDQPPAPDTDGGGEGPWIGAERTVAGAEGIAEARAERARQVREAREAKEAAQRSDGLWHTDGRSGPCTGMVWGDYEVGAVLGEGGMGIVYKGRQASLNRRVAIKVLPSAMAADATLRERFEMESRSASLLQSPHVVQVFTAGNEDGNLYFVMEYVEGRELSDIIRETYGNGGRLQPYDAGDYIVQAARGLMEAQRHNFVHRDIKPANLMVTNDGLVKIADFGIVKAVGEHTLTMTGTAVGTPSYVSPEQGKGESTDARADIYSLGVVFYELLTGERPFSGSTPNALIYQHCYAEPKLPSEIQPDIPQEYEAVVIKCLQKKPEDRYPDAGALVQDLERIQIGHSPMVAVFAGKIGTGADAAMRANMNWFQRNFWFIAAGLLAIVFLGGGGFYWRWSNQARAAELRTTLEDLDNAAVPPAGAQAYLKELASLSPDDDETVKRWSDKLEQILAIEARLNTALAEDVLANELRQSVERDLTAYEGLVGTQGAKQDQVRELLAASDVAIDRLRIDLDQLTADDYIVQANRSAFDDTLLRYQALVPADDPALVRAQREATATDERIAQLRKQLNKDMETYPVLPIPVQGPFEDALAALVPLIPADDTILSQARDRLRGSRASVAGLKSSLQDQLGGTEVVGPALEQAVKEDIERLLQLAGEADEDYRKWTGLLNRSRLRIAEWQQKIDAYKEARFFPAARHQAADGWINELASLVGEDDDRVVRGRDQLRRSQAALAASDRLLQRFDDPKPMKLVEQQRLTSALADAEALQSIDQVVADGHRQRLEREQANLERLREACADFDKTVSITPAMRKALEQALDLIGSDDEQVRRWLDKDTVVRSLQNGLAALDRAEPLPERVDEDLRSLQDLVGDRDADWRRWRDAVVTVRRLRRDLAVLDQVAPLPANAATDVAQLIQLVGDSEDDVRRWEAKVERVGALKAALTDCDEAFILPPDAEAQLAELLTLVSDADPDCAHYAERVRVLAGPPRPAWAIDWGRDEFGRFAVSEVDGVQFRWRYVPPGTLQLGSPEDEAGRETDERQVQITLTKPFWVAETECTQEQFQVLMGRNPARFDNHGKRPVERVTWQEAVDCAAAMSAPVGRLPTEAEWEYLCRAGQPGPRPSVDDLAGELPIERLAELGHHASVGSAVVGQRLPNALGLYDCLGNVWEWVDDGYAPYPVNPAVDHVGKGVEQRVARGGSWGDEPLTLRAANRVALEPAMKTMYVGFRLVAVADFAVDPLAPTEADDPAAPQPTDPGEPLAVRQPALPARDPAILDALLADDDQALGAVAPEPAAVMTSAAFTPFGDRDPAILERLLLDDDEEPVADL